MNQEQQITSSTRSQALARTLGVMAHEVRPTGADPRRFWFRDHEFLVLTTNEMFCRCRGIVRCNLWTTEPECLLGFVRDSEGHPLAQGERAVALASIHALQARGREGNPPLVEAIREMLPQFIHQCIKTHGPASLLSVDGSTMLHLVPSEAVRGDLWGFRTRVGRARINLHVYPNRLP